MLVPPKLPARLPAAAPPPYRSPQSRQKGLHIMLAVTAVAAVLAGLAAWERYRFAGDGLRLGAVTPDRYDALGHRRGVTDLLLAVPVAVAAVAWLLWFGRVYGNLRALGATWTRLSPVTAVAVCALPGVNLVMAPWLAGEAWRSSDPRGPDRVFPGGGSRWPPPLVLLWTATVLLTLAVGVVAEKTAHRTLDQLGPVRSGTRLELVAALLVVVSAGFTFRLSAALTARQEARAVRLGPAS